VQSTAMGVSLVGVSIPRSGHHFLAKLLENALGDDLAYCEFYSAADCCRQLPCIRRHRSRITYQKNHDMDLAIDPDLPGVRYVVQYRNPVPAVVSDRELFAEVRGSALARDRSQYVMVLSEKAAHYARFYDKWVRHPHGSRFLMKYEWLCDAPAEAIDALIRFCGFSVTAERIAGAVAKVAPVVNRPPIVKDIGEARFAARDPARSEYFDPDLLATYESLVLDRIPELSTDRLFAPADYAAHPLSAMFEVQCARLDGPDADAARLALAAHRQWPTDPYVAYVAAECLRKTGDREAALSHLERAVDTASHDAQIPPVPRRDAIQAGVARPGARARPECGRARDAGPRLVAAVRQYHARGPARRLGARRDAPGRSVIWPGPLGGDWRMANGRAAWSRVNAGAALTLRGRP
jgi:hypothetical protein